MSDTVLKEKYKGYKIKIVRDTDPMNPRTENDNAGTMVCWHKGYDLGDKHSYNEPDAFANFLAQEIAPEVGDDHEINSWSEVEEVLDKLPIYWLPLFLYDHSGITMNTTGFNCPWDSGQVGYIYITEADAEKEYGADDSVSVAEAQEWKDRVYNTLRAEVQEFDHYITGQCYGYTIKRKKKEIDSCYGFLGDTDYVLKEARGVVDSILKQDT